MVGVPPAGLLWRTSLSLNRGRSGRRVAVLVFASQRAMLAWYRGWSKRHRKSVQFRTLERDTAGFTAWAGQPLPEFGPREHGFVLLHRARAGVGVVAHEFVHVAHFSVQLHEYSGAHDWDERVAWMVGSLCSQYWKRFYRSPLAR